MVRGLAALLVLGGHLRSFTFDDYVSISDPGLTTTLFYGITGLGHQAVVVFFAMSGFLVGGKALDDMLTGRWSWRWYLLRRLTRLLIVVIPALCLTAVLDGIGILATGGVGFDLSLRTYNSIPLAPNYTIGTFVGNLAFLQTIAVPIFGTNGPMWSLANEFWYYLIFPLAASLTLVPYLWIGRLLSISILGACIFILPWEILELGSIWIAGAGGAWLCKQPTFELALRHNGARISVCVLMIVVLVLTRNAQRADVADLIFGMTVAIALPILVVAPTFGKFYQSSTRAAAEISYTLYLTHFPFLTFLVMVGLAPHRFQPGWSGAVVYGGLLICALAWATGVWWCFERKTERVFRYLVGRPLLQRIR
jgi:peptidoglycan/LPS O-acetylase OafA/YrhL